MIIKSNEKAMKISLQLWTQIKPEILKEISPITKALLFCLDVLKFLCLPLGLLL